MIKQKAETPITCPIEGTLQLIAGKWKLIILWHLSQHDVMRYGEIRSALQHITHKMLSQQLKELETDELIHRQSYNVIPPRVEYSLTERGKSLLPVIQSMSVWGASNLSHS